MTDNRQHPAPFLQAVKRILLETVLFLLLLPITAQASPLVSATYQHADGREIAVMITIGSPPPSSLILAQRFPPGMTILRSSPPAQRIDPQAGEAKWLFHQLKSGTMRVSITFDREVTASQISGQIRYRSTRGEGMESITVSKP